MVAAPRYFLYTYAVRENYPITRAQKVFGAPKYGLDHLATKIWRLSLGDIILVRDGTRDELYFLGYFAVGGRIHDQEEGGTPWPDHLWHDEQRQRKLIYHLRCAVDFDYCPQLSLSRLQWSDLDRLGFLNHRGKRIEGHTAWGSKLRGNFIEDPKEIAAFHEMVRYEPIQSP